MDSGRPPSSPKKTNTFVQPWHTKLSNTKILRQLNSVKKHQHQDTIETEVHSEVTTKETLKYKNIH